MSPEQARNVAMRSEPEAAKTIRVMSYAVDNLRAERVRLKDTIGQLRRDKQDLAIAQVEHLLALRRQSRIIAHINEIIKS